MPRKKTREELVLDLTKTKRKAKRSNQEVKILEKMLSEQIRKERTHRLCNHGADLEVYLKPEVFTDEEIRSILKEIFALPSVIELVEKATPSDVR